MTSEPKNVRNIVVTSIHAISFSDGALMRKKDQARLCTANAARGVEKERRESRRKKRSEKGEARRIGANKDQAGLCTAKAARNEKEKKTLEMGGKNTR